MLVAICQRTSQAAAIPSRSFQVSLDISHSLVSSLQPQPALDSLLGYQTAVSSKELQALHRFFLLQLVPKFRAPSLMPYLQRSQC